MIYANHNSKIAGRLGRRRAARSAASGYHPDMDGPQSRGALSQAALAYRATVEEAATARLTTDPGRSAVDG